jgi:hypothetical protein
MAKERGGDMKKAATAGDKAGEGAGQAQGGDEKGWKGTVRQSLLAALSESKKLGKPWESAKRIFDFRNAGKALHDALPDSGTGLALKAFLLSGLILFLVSVFTLFASAYLVNTQADVIIDATGQAQAKVGPGEMVQPILLSFLVYLPIGILLSLGLEWASFHAMRAIGGKGTFAQQLYLASIIAIGMSFASGMNIFAPVPCLQLLGGMCILAASIYLTLFVGSQAYATVHRIHPAAAFVMALAVAVARMAILYFAINGAAAILGMPPQMTIPGNLPTGG